MDVDEARETLERGGDRAKVYEARKTLVEDVARRLDAIERIFQWLTTKQGTADPKAGR
jgi:hypothetical protein